jgi:hypothetical protein
MKRLLGYGAGALMLAAPLLATTALAQGLPPADAKPGECYAKVLVPAVYKTYSEQVLVHAGGVNYTKTPAVYKDVQKTVLISEESYELVPVPPTYDTVQETILVQPEQVVKTVVPATFRTETKRVMISPSRVMWKAGRGAYEKIDSATGEIMCRVEVPAQYKDISQQVVATPAQTQERTLPAKYVTVTRRVVKTEASTTRRVIPPQYKTITVKELVTPESFTAVKTEPRYSAIEKRELVTPESVQWRQILCETNVTQNVVMNIQRALVREGFSIGTQPNGNYGPATKAAIRKFQLANGLPTGGLTLSTVKKLGL